DVEVTGIALKSEGREEPLEPGRVADPGAGEYVRLGDMLRARGRNAAAGVEYDKAFAINPKNPSVASRQALGMLWRKDYEKALEAVSGVIDIYEDRTVLWMRKGEALMGLGRFGEASAAFGEIMEINPFDEPARMALYEAYKKAGNSQRAEEELKNLKIISGAGGKNPHDGH
ncbi:tetratricopeptide repeat protein, partial [bacterium]